MVEKLRGTCKRPENSFSQRDFNVFTPLRNVEDYTKSSLFDRARA